MGFMVLGLQEETKSEATVVCTSGLIYKYLEIESQYSKETRKLLSNELTDAQYRTVSVAKGFVSKESRMTHAYWIQWR